MDDPVLAPADTLNEIFLLLGSLGKWLQAIGLVIVLWLVFQVVNGALNVRRWRDVQHFREAVVRIEEKLDRLLRRVERRK